MDLLPFLNRQPSSAELKQEKILKASLQIILEEGLSFFSLTEIAKKTGISKPLISYYYSDLNEIILTLFKVAATSGQRITEQESQKTDCAMSAQINGAFEWARMHPDFCRYFTLMYHLAPTRKEIQVVHDAVLEKGLQRLKKCVAEYKTGKEEIELTALALHNLLVGSIIRMGSQNDFNKLETYKKSVFAAYNQILKTKLG